MNADGSTSAAGAEHLASGRPATAVGPYTVLVNKRGPVACKRCRRAKTKCIHTGQPPCRSCAESGLAAECVFPPKGTSFIDRAPGKKPKRATTSPVPIPLAVRKSVTPIATSMRLRDPHEPDGAPSPASSSSRTRMAASPVVSEETLPPHALLEEACEIFFGQVNQCAFLHKPSFLARLRSPNNQPSPLILLSICALTVRFSPSLAQFCGNTKKSASYFHDTGRALLFESLGEPSVEACQAGYFLGLSDWSACRGRRSWMIMGIAMRMALLLGLHREETHALPPNPTPADIVRVEQARRTFWTLFNNDRATSGGGASCRPSGIQLSEISTRLPCDEDSFAFGTQTPAYYLHQLDDPGWFVREGPVDLGMMAYMVQSAELWGRAARRACAGPDAVAPPWDPDSAFAQIKSSLSRWRAQLPPRQQYSRGNLAVYHQRNQGMSFSYNHALNQAAEVMIRRPYLPYIVRSLAPEGGGLGMEDVATSRLEWDAARPDFWTLCGTEMFEAAFGLVQIILDFVSLTQYSSLSPHLGFHTYLAAATLTYVWRWPWLLPERAYEAPALVLRATDILSSMIPTWPMARQWVRILRQPIQKRIDEAVRDDVAADQREGVYRQSSISNHAETEGSNSSVSGDDEPPAIPLGRQWSVAAAPSLHTLALAAQHHPRGQYAPPHGDVPGGYTVLGPYSEMPFGDASNPNSFGDVLAFMEGSEQWNWPG